MSGVALEAQGPHTIPSHTYHAGQLAEILGVDRGTILEWARSGIIPPGRPFGKRTLRWTPDDIAPLLAARREA
jgi:hypothetical protein